MASLPLAGNALHKSEMKYNGKFGHTIGRIQHIALMIRIYICYATYHLAKQTVSPNLPGIQGINICVQYIYGFFPKRCIKFSKLSSWEPLI